jgi:hypothetical protein
LELGRIRSLLLPLDGRRIHTNKEDAIDEITSKRSDVPIQIVNGKGIDYWPAIAISKACYFVIVFACKHINLALITLNDCYVSGYNQLPQLDEFRSFLRCSGLSDKFTACLKSRN